MSKRVVHYRTSKYPNALHVVCNMWVYEYANGDINVVHTVKKKEVTCKNCLKAMLKIRIASKPKPSKRQNKLMTDFQNHCVFEFLSFEDVRADNHEEFKRLWDMNIQWLRDHIDETNSLMDVYEDD